MSSSERADDASARSSSQHPLVRLLAYARPYVGLILLAVVLAVGFSAGRYGRAYLIKPVFDDVIGPSQALHQAGDSLPFDIADWVPGMEVAEKASPDAPPAEEFDNERLKSEIRDSLGNIIMAMLLIIFAMPLIMFGREYTVAWVMGRISLDMKLEMCGRMLNLPLRFHKDKRRGDLYARLMGDVSQAHSALNMLFGDFVEAAVMLVVGAAALVYVSWKLSFVMLITGPLIFLTISVFGRRIRKNAHRRQRQFADVTSRLVEILEGIKVIKAFRAEKYELGGFSRASNRLFRRGMRVVVTSMMARVLVDGMNNLASIGVLVLGIYLVLGGHWGLSMGDLAAFSAISVTLYKPVRKLARGWVSLMDVQPSAERYFEVIDSPDEIDEAEDAVAIGRFARSIRYQDVSFSYGREPVLRHVDFEVKRGEMIAIVGRTGAGKTTLVDLLLRFYDPSEGRIEIDGVDLRGVRRDELLDQMAVVSQEPFLFDGSVRDNIRYGRLEASEEEILTAARAAHVDEFVGELPDGYDTEVGAAGTRLSGGQRQRVTIARAILRDPAILVLDEATSSLDSKSERLVQDAIDKLMPGRTAFVIAHRLSTVRSASKILVLEEGRVSQIGTHDELLAESGLYRELVEIQTGSGDLLAPPAL